MIQFDTSVGANQKSPTPTPSVVRNPTPPKNLRLLTTPTPAPTPQPWEQPSKTNNPVCSDVRNKNNVPVGYMMRKWYNVLAITFIDTATRWANGLSRLVRAIKKPK